MISAAEADEPFAVASFKAFGDFVIAHSILSAVATKRAGAVRILAGSHLQALAAALPSQVPVTIVPVLGDDLPALFDIRRRGLAAGLRSAKQLRRAFAALKRLPSERLLFDRIGARERWLAGDWRAHSLPPGRKNIYEAYIEVLNASAFGAVEQLRDLPSSRTVGIFPSSRLATKVVPAAVVEALCRIVQELGFEPEIFHMEGDEVGATPRPVTTVPRRFESLMAALSSVRAVISADSLPAHLAEYLGRRVFVVSPKPNTYWLPLRSFRGGHHAVFGDADMLTEPLRRFLAPAPRAI